MLLELGVAKAEAGAQLAAEPDSHHTQAVEKRVLAVARCSPAAEVGKIALALDSAEGPKGMGESSLVDLVQRGDNQKVVRLRGWA